MARALITDASLHDHVSRLGELNPPLRLGAVDRTVRDPAAMRARFGGVIDYLARVELEVDRNVLELLTLLPDVSEIDRFFYQDVWQPQEIAHGIILDQLQTDVGLPPTEPYLPIVFSMKMLGALAHLHEFQDISRFMYYLTGAATEREAVIAYSAFIRGLRELGETAVEKTIVAPIKQQEPGHFAFYQMSATRMLQDDELRPWQLFMVRQLRNKSFAMVGTDGVAAFLPRMGEVMVKLGYGEDAELAQFAREIGRLEARLLWAEDEGLDFPPYVLRALRDCVAAYREELRAQGIPA